MNNKANLTHLDIIILSVIILLTSGCAGNRVATLQNLNDRNLSINKEKIENVTEEEVMGSYHDYLGDAPASHPMYANALNRLADLEMKAGDDKLMSDQDEIFQQALQAATTNAGEQGQHNYQNAIDLYTGLLIANPDSPKNDWVMYQLASAYEKLGNLEAALETLGRLISAYPSSDYYMEAQFRSGDIHFLLQDYLRAEKAFKTVFLMGKKTVYFEKSIYKYAWSMFKQEHYEKALDLFFISLSTLPIVYDLQQKIDTRALSKVEKDILDDIFRAVNLCISYGGGVKYAAEYFNKFPKGEIEYEVFKRLGDYFIEHDRKKDAADTYGLFVMRQPFHPMASTLQVRRISAYDGGRFGRAALVAREEFVNQFGVDTEFWEKQNSATKSLLRAQAKSILNDLSQFYHARLQRNKKNNENYRKAVYWYQQYIKTFPGDAIAANKQFLLGELYSEKRDYIKSANAYFKSAYDYDDHALSREAAYAAVEAYSRIKKTISNKGAGRGLRKTSSNLVNEVNEKFIVASIKFADRFPEDKNTVPILVKLTEELYALRRFDESLKYAQQVLMINNPQPHKNKILTRHQAASNIIGGHIAFERKDYLQAQSHYKKSIDLGVPDRKLKKIIAKRLTAATYKYAEILEREGNFTEAAESFMSVSNTSPGSNISAQAQYDAATTYIKLEKWGVAIQILERFRKKYPLHKLQVGVTDKLAVCFEKTNQYSKAAREIMTIGKRANSQSTYRDATLQAAKLYEKDGTRNSAIATYKFYIRNFKLPFEMKLEAKQKLINLYTETNQLKKRHYWIKNIVASKYKESVLTDRSKFILSDASLFLANEKMSLYEKVKLNLPLRKTLNKKKKRMKAALVALEKVSSFGVEEFTTAATYNIAAIYQHLGGAIMESQRPRGLSSEEREEYDLLLEEQAYPFEEKAIGIHEINVQRISKGVYDQWVQKSISRLALIQPVRYEKEEIVNEMYTAID